MPVTVQVEAIELQNSQGEKRVVNMMADQTTARLVQELTESAERQKQRIQDKGDEVLSSIPKDYKELNESIDDIQNKKIDKPTAEDSNKFPRAKNGEVEWVEYGLPTDTQTETAVANWLNEHPEATTTVQDGAITIEKLSDDVKLKISTSSTSAEVYGINGYPTEEQARADQNGYASKNREALQNALNGKKGIIFSKGYYPFDEYISLPESFYVSGAGKDVSVLVFPNSRGFVYERPLYYHNFCMDGFNIISKDACITARNGNARPTAHNVYQGEYRNLFLKSENGNCIESSYKNYAASGNQLYFEVRFYNITVNAPNGDGFVDIFGLGIVFERCNDRYAINNVFRNCTGKWKDVNVTFANAKYFLYFDNTFGAYTNSLEFYGCNSEDVLNGFIGYDTSHKEFGIQNLIMIDQGISIQGSPKNNQIIDLPRLETLVSFACEYNNYPVGFDTTVVKAPIRLYEAPSSVLYTDRNVNQFITKANYLSKNNSIIKYEFSPVLLTKGEYMRRPVYSEISAELIYGQRIITKKVITEIVNSTINLDAHADCAIDTIEFKIPTNKNAIFVNIGDRTIGRFITMTNTGDGIITLGSTNSKFEGVDYPCTFRSKDSGNVVTLNKYETATFVLSHRDIGVTNPKIEWKQL